MVEARGRLRHRRRLYKADRRLPAPRAADLAGREQEDGIPVVEALKKDDVARLTELIEAGINAKVVSERLGHASIGITLDTYSHVMPGMQEEAAEKIDAGLRKALAG